MDVQFNRLTDGYCNSYKDDFPKATFSYLDDAGEVQTTIISDLTKGKKAIIFAVPRAFTPTCLQKHVQQSAELKVKGVDRIACDAFVMKVWKKYLLKLNDEVLLLSDGNGTFTKAIGCELNLSAAARI
ncbi:peroxiredoxin-2E, chloroplastic-like [Arachis stenosperma]|uniref:peroxiredoxin-2E, chloroplastic-like n=1 Tax=Arachis stenosperma TaxID=217475 RepID=UPI0025AD80AB|nr:peroxiredoxin-2E, chloroplastic-like [Arachis stenosperma]